MNLPKQTAEIFTVLSKGAFISSNSTLPESKLYEIIHNENNFSLLKEYFSQINFSLERGNGYFYFSQIDETQKSREDKLLRFEMYIDILDFFSCLDNKPVVGSRFRLSEIAEDCNANVRLKTKLLSIKVANKNDTLVDRLREIAEYMRKDTFLEKEEEEEEQYKVLDSFHYLEEVVTKISITNDKSI